jgi:hypothetical protein
MRTESRSVYAFNLTEVSDELYIFLQMMDQTYLAYSPWWEKIELQKRTALDQIPEEIQYVLFLTTREPYRVVEKRHGTETILSLVPKDKVMQFGPLKLRTGAEQLEHLQRLCTPSPEDVVG